MFLPTWTGVCKQHDVISHKIPQSAGRIQDGDRYKQPHKGEREGSDSPTNTTTPESNSHHRAPTDNSDMPPGVFDATRAGQDRQADRVGRGGPPRPASPGRPTMPNSHTTSADAGPTAPKGHQTVYPDFNRVRKVCAKGNYESANIDLRPLAFAQYKRDKWPSPVPGSLSDEYIKIYDVVRRTGLPNAMGACIQLPSILDRSAWSACLDEIGGRPQLLDFITYGFPLGYVGPVSDTKGTRNHPSAADYPDQVQAFLKKEISLGGVLGPAKNPHFHPWCHISPLMSRPKNDGDRRIITDMTFPSECSVNAYVVKNGVYGIEMDHTLPTSDNLVQHIRNMPPGVFLATLDISRAYKNFTSDPLDWPLLCFQWGEDHYCDLTLPFGARASSFHMQTAANAIVDILAARGVKAFMYLDDIILISPDRSKAEADFDTARRLLRQLSLPEAEAKAQAPATKVKWLGVNIDTVEMSLAIPEEKITQVLSQVSRYASARSMTKKNLQSILGQLIHVAKCVRPARLFVARLLEALRACTGTYINVNADMRADFRWFQEFCAQLNGKSYVPAPDPAKDIYVDACLSGIGGSDGTHAYAGQVAPVEDGAVNITQLEAANVIVALHTLLSYADAGSHVRVHCDNMAAVQVLQTGRGKNRVLLDCARAAWMVQAVLDIQISYVHVPGENNELADSLSRGHLSHKYHYKVGQLINEHSLQLIPPCLHVFHNIPAPILSRSGHQIITRQGSNHTTSGQGTRNMGESGLFGAHLCSVRKKGGISTAQTRQVHDVRPDRVPRPAHPSTRDCKEQGLTYKELHQNGRGGRHGHTPPAGATGTRGARPEQGIQVQGQGRHRHEGPQVSSVCYTRVGGGDCRTRRHPAHVLWRAETVRDSPTIPLCQMGQKHAEGGPNTFCHIHGHKGPKTMSSQGNKGSLRPHPLSLIFRPALAVPQDAGPNPSIHHQGDLECRTRHCGRGLDKALTAQPKEGSCHTGTYGRLWGYSYTEARGMEVQRLQGVHRHTDRHSS